jgi:hypothetical protein
VSEPGARMVRVALRFEILFFLLVVLVLVGFIWTYAAQK